MKLLFVLTQLEVGGAQTRVLQTAAEMRKQGHTVDVAFLYSKRDSFQDEPKIVLSPGGGAKGAVKALSALFKRLRRENYHAVITNTAPANILGNLTAMLARVPVRMAVQTQPPQNLKSLYRILDKICGSLGVYTRNIANSRWTFSCFEEYPARYRRRMTVVLNGLTPRVSPLSRDEAREKLQIDASRPVIVTVGRLSKQKGQRFAIEALKGVDGQLFIVGDGELRTDLESLAESSAVADSVTFVGEVPGVVVADYLRAADVFLFPSLWETFGLAALEGAAAGLPIVANDLDVLREVLINDEEEAGAEFVEVETPGELAKALGHVLSDAKLREEMGQRSRSIADLHSLERHVGALLKVVDSERARIGSPLL